MADLFQRKSTRERAVDRSFQIDYSGLPEANIPLYGALLGSINERASGTVPTVVNVYKTKPTFKPLRENDRSQDIANQKARMEALVLETGIIEKNGSLFQVEGFDVDSAKGKRYLNNLEGFKKPQTLKQFKQKAYIRWAQAYNRMVKSTVTAGKTFTYSNFDWSALVKNREKNALYRSENKEMLQTKAKIRRAMELGQGNLAAGLNAQRESLLKMRDRIQQSAAIQNFVQKGEATQGFTGNPRLTPQFIQQQAIASLEARKQGPGGALRNRIRELEEMMMITGNPALKRTGRKQQQQQQDEFMEQDEDTVQVL